MPAPSSSKGADFAPRSFADAARIIRSLGEDFEKKEHQLFGKEGFEGIVEKVAAIEKELGIYDLAKFTPAG